MVVSCKNLQRDNESDMHLARHHREFGFGVIELLIVAALLAGLGYLVFPRAQVFWATARQAEAKQLLSQVHSLEQTYHQYHGRYSADFTAIGYQAHGTQVTPSFVAAPKGKRYALSFFGVPDDKTFVALATALPRTLAPCQEQSDIWGIDAEKTLTNKPGNGVDGVKDGLKRCP